MRTARLTALLMGIGFFPACYDGMPTDYDNATPDEGVPLEVARSGSSSNLAGHYAYVNRVTGNDVLVIDLATNTVVETVPVGDGPFNLAITPDGTRVYLANLRDGTVSVIETASNTLLAPVSLNELANEVAVTVDGTEVYATDGANMSVIDVSTNSIIATFGPLFPIPAGWVDVVMSPDEIYAYAVSENGGLLVIDLRTRQIARRYGLQRGAVRVAVTPDGAFIYISQRFSAEVLVLNARAAPLLSIAARVPVGQLPHGLAVSPNGAFVYVPNRSTASNTVSVIDVATNTVVTNVDIGTPPSEVAFSPDGSLAYVVLSGYPEELVLVDVSTHTVVDRISFEGNLGPSGIVITPVPLNSPPDLTSVTGPPDPVLLGTEATVVGHFTDPDAGDAHTATVDWGDTHVTAADVDEVAGTATGRHPYEGPGAYTVTVAVTDPYNESDSEVFEFVVVYAAPDLVTLTGPSVPVPVGDEVTVIGTFTDLDEEDIHTAMVDWGDTHVTATDVDEVAGTATGMHSYDAPGVYTVTMTLTDSFGASDTEEFEFVVVYDADGGFVTGGGWIDSPAGAFANDPDLTGKANFGFVAKYKKGATVPTGNTEFQFKAGDLNFHSTSYEWLVVNQGGTRAQFKGEGMINGTGLYKFMIWADDDEIDTFQIRITEVGGGLVYDNGVTQPIGGGSIKVHTK